MQPMLQHTELLTSKTLYIVYFSADLMPRGALKSRQCALALLPFLSLPIVITFQIRIQSAFVRFLHEKPHGCYIYETTDVLPSSFKQIIALKPLESSLHWTLCHHRHLCAFLHVHSFLSSRNHFLPSSYKW